MPAELSDVEAEYTLFARKIKRYDGHKKWVEDWLMVDCMCVQHKQRQGYHSVSESTAAVTEHSRNEKVLYGSSLGVSFWRGML